MMLPRTTTLLVALSAAALVGPGCNCNKKKTKKKETTGAAKQAPGNKPQTSTPPRARPILTKDRSLDKARSLAKRRMAKVTADEAKAALPQPAGSSVLSAPQELNGGRLVKSTICFSNMNAESAAAALTKTLETDGWQNVNSRAHPQRPNRFGLSAQKPPYRLTASVAAGHWPNCKKTDNKIWASLIMHKVEAPKPHADQ